MKNIKKTTLIGLSSLALALGMMAGPALADGGHRGHGEGRHYSYSDSRGDHRGDRNYRYYQGNDGRYYRYYRGSSEGNRESNMKYRNTDNGRMYNYSWARSGHGDRGGD